MHSIQFFVRNVPELRNDELTIDSTFPLINFATKTAAYNFIGLLRAEPAHGIANVGYLILNNPQLLPYNVRTQHQYRVAKISDDPENERDEEIFMDGCFSIERNIDILMNVVDQIDNNNLGRARGEAGFREFIQTHSRNYR
jgi:hypothetical protein